MNPLFKDPTTFRSQSDKYYVALIETYGRARNLRSGQKLHAHLIITSLAKLTTFAAKLTSFYTECGEIKHARKLFDKMPHLNIDRWIVLIGAYSRRGYHQEALSLFKEMQNEGVKINEFVMPSVLKSCGHLFNRKTGEKLHGLIFKFSYENDAFVNSSLIDMYSKCGHLESAKKVFNSMFFKDLVSLNALVLGFVHHGLVKNALDLVENMQSFESLSPNIVTWNTLLTGFAQTGDKEKVSRIFELMRVDGITPDLVSWTSIMSGFAKNFCKNEAFDAFRTMIKDHRLIPSSNTISSILPVCSTIADLQHGKEIHAYAFAIGVERDIYVRSALIDMYSKCGLLSESETLFNAMIEKNTVTWNSMIFGYANHGYNNKAIELFTRMEQIDVQKLDHLTFTAVLTACSHGGMVELGKVIFSSIKEKYGIEYRLEHYACMVDLLGRAGKINEAYDFIKEMPMEPDSFVWGALLGACRIHGNIDLAKVAAEHLYKLEPKSAGSSLLMSNLYADTGCWENAAEMKKIIKSRKFSKLPSRSWINSV